MFLSIGTARNLIIFSRPNTYVYYGMYQRILQKCSFSDPLPRLFKPFGFVKKHGRQGAGLIFPIQGGHALWKTGKTGKMVKKNSLQGKIREFEILLKIREKSGNFEKSYLCKVKIFKFYSCLDVATRGG